MMIYPAVHYTIGGIWCDYNLMTTIPGCYAAGEANFSDHGANRLGASALMQGLADGYFVLPYTIGDYLANDIRTGTISTDLPEFNEAAKEVTDRLEKLINIKGTKSVDHFHKRLGEVMWNKVGMARNAKGLTEAMDEIKTIPYVNFYSYRDIDNTIYGFDIKSLYLLLSKDTQTKNPYNRKPIPTFVKTELK